MANENFNPNDVFASETIFSKVKKVLDTESTVSFKDGIIPETMKEMEFMYHQMNRFDKSIHRDSVLNLSFEQQKTEFKKYWSMKNPNSFKRVVETFLAKLNFIQSNFTEYEPVYSVLEPTVIYFTPVSVISIERWKSDKAKIYMKYGDTCYYTSRLFKYPMYAFSDITSLPCI